MMAMLLPLLTLLATTWAKWFDELTFILDAVAANIDLGGEITLTANDGTTEMTFRVIGGELNFGDLNVELTTTGNIIIPSNLIVISARSLTLTADKIGGGADGNTANNQRLDD